jgi:riboflavin kinase
MGYVEQFKEKLGFSPYPGTLNVKIELIERNKLRFLKNNPAIEISEFKTRNRTFGAVRCFKAEINGISGAIVLPMRSHYSNVLEFISPTFLREKLRIRDDDEVNIVIYLN